MCKHVDAKKKEEKDKKRAEIWLEAGEALDLYDRDLRYADFSKAKLWDADLREAQLQGAALRLAELQGAVLSRARLQGTDLRWAELQGAVLSRAQLKGASLRKARVYGTEFRDAELSLTDLWGLRSLPVDSKGWSSQIEGLETKLKEEGEHWPEKGRERIEQTIDHLRSIDFDKPTVIPAPQESNV